MLATRSFGRFVSKKKGYKAGLWNILYISSVEDMLSGVTNVVKI